MSIHKLILGTAGLGGLAYGAEKRIVQEPDAIKLMQYAWECGIRRFDTAPAYGEAETWLGKAMHGKSFAVSTKTTGDVDVALRSMERLYAENVTFLWHNWDVKGLPRWVRGGTVYARDFKEYPPVIIQQDWNLLQQCVPFRKVPTLIARSVFLQGQLTETATPRPALAPMIDRARRLAAIFGVDLTTLALRAALEEPEIDYVLIGPTTLAELDQCMEIAERKPLNANAMIPMLHHGGPETDPRAWKTP